MKKRLLVIGVMFSMLALINGCSKKEESSEITSESKKVIQIGATGQSYPNSFMQDGKLMGFDVEVAEAIAETLGLTINWTTAEFAGIIGQLDAGRLDTIANVVAITEAREKKFNFSEPYSFLGSQVVTHINNVDINEHEDLHGKTISGVLGSNHVMVLQKFFSNNEVDIRTYETRDGAMSDLIAQRVDGYINSKPILLSEINRNNLPFKLVGEPLAMEKIGFPFAKDEGGAKLRNEFNIALKKLLLAGKVKELSIKYFGEDISASAPTAD